MNKSQVTELTKWFHELAVKLGATGDGTRHFSKADIIPGTYDDATGYSDHSYGYYLRNTKYGLLTFNLKAETGRNSTICVMAKFLDTERLKSAPPSLFSGYRDVNGTKASDHNGKWNLHLGVIEIERAKHEIARMFDLRGLF